MLQQGHKLPKWQPRYRRGIFVTLSTNLSCDVNMILNPDTGHIYPQFHVIFEYSFIIVLSISPEEEHTSFWNEFDPNDFLYLVPLNYNDQAYLYAEWITPD